MIRTGAVVEVGIARIYNHTLRAIFAEEGDRVFAGEINLLEVGPFANEDRTRRRVTGWKEIERALYRIEIARAIGRDNELRSATRWTCNLGRKSPVGAVAETGKG